MLFNFLADAKLSGLPLYLDPGSGSYLIQLLLAASLGGAFAIKIYWKRITAFFGGLFGKKTVQDEVPAEKKED
jgi:hypothetical protein